VSAGGRPDTDGPVVLVNDSAAMAPAYPVGGHVLVDRDAYRGARRPAVGDVVAVTPTAAIRAACGSTSYPLPDPVLRVAGVPGDRDVGRGGLLYCDSARVQLPVELRATPRYDRDFGVVPQGTGLVLGGNRPRPCAALVWAPGGTPFVPVDALVGRVLTRPS